MRAHALLVCALAILPTTGCTLLPFGGIPNAARAQRPSAMGHGLKEFRAAFHVHSFLSHDSRGSIPEIARAARDLRLDTVILSDHYKDGNVARAPRGVQWGVLFIPGVELRAGDKGSILSFPLEEDFSNKLTPAQRAREMARQGAVNVYGHCEELQDWSLEPFQGFEVYNLHAEFMAQSFWSIAWKFIFLPPDSFFRAAISNPLQNLAAWDRELLGGKRLAALAGHDAHANVRLFGPLGGTIGTYPEVLRLFSNHILAPDWSVESIAQGVRSGRTFVVFDYLAEGTGFAMSYGPPGASPDDRALLGDTAAFAAEHTVEVRLPPGDAASCEIRLVSSGEVVATRQGESSLVTGLTRPGIVRAEVYRGNRLWIVGSPIYITPVEASR